MKKVKMNKETKTNCMKKKKIVGKSFRRGERNLSWKGVKIPGGCPR